MLGFTCLLEQATLLVRNLDSAEFLYLLILWEDMSDESASYSNDYSELMVAVYKSVYNHRLGPLFLLFE